MSGTSCLTSGWQQHTQEARSRFKPTVAVLFTGNKHGFSVNSEFCTAPRSKMVPPVLKSLISLMHDLKIFRRYFKTECTIAK